MDQNTYRRKPSPIRTTTAGGSNPAPSSELLPMKFLDGRDYSNATTTNDIQMLGHHAYRPGVLYLPRYTILTVFIAMAGIMWAKVYGFRQKVPARGLCLWCEHKSPRKMSVKEGDNMNLVSYESANGFSRRTNLNKDSTLLDGLNESMVGNQPC
ncbi:uncharacterized protein LOC108857513 isoform X3 [Raphanus sativus]|uniref:Uncharacterized protein LOC108857513 isoform X3 n=1 Tax=Raphanus sativus TaxID=3726 RepID=A0A9W3DJH1_RAPSA|nr:uncharacterized protein LOC108857513 isoform X3 [Raphanus sativus]